MHKWRDRLACGFLVTGTVVGVALAASTQGSREDPLVTLSYLNDVTIPSILQQVDEKLVQREDELVQKLQNAGGGNQTGFRAVTLAAGTTVTLNGGTQLLLRTGAASTPSPLVDLTTGGAVEQSLLANHLCLATADGQTVTFVQDSTVMISGGYQ